MHDLHDWLKRQLDEKQAEPNSALGGAIATCSSTGSTLTLFLRQAGAPLDNNVCERALKKAILHRKNALFYKTRNGARVGDLFMSLIYTCQLNQANPFDYLTQLQRHADALATHARAVDAVELPRRAGLITDRQRKPLAPALAGLRRSAAVNPPTIAGQPPSPAPEVSLFTPPVGHAEHHVPRELTTTPRPLAPFGSYRVPKEGQSSGRARLLRAAEFTRGGTPGRRGQGLG